MLWRVRLVCPKPATAGGWTGPTRSVTTGCSMPGVIPGPFGAERKCGFSRVATGPQSLKREATRRSVELDGARPPAGCYGQRKRTSIGTVVNMNRPTRVWWPGPKRSRLGTSFFASVWSALPRNPADRTDLPQRKTNNRNERTAGSALIGGRYEEQATRPHAPSGRIAREANAWGNTQDMLTRARLRGR